MAVLENLLILLAPVVVGFAFANMLGRRAHGEEREFKETLRRGETVQCPFCGEWVTPDKVWDCPMRCAEDESPIYP